VCWQGRWRSAKVCDRLCETAIVVYVHARLAIALPAPCCPCCCGGAGVCAGLSAVAATVIGSLLVGFLFLFYACPRWLAHREVTYSQAHALDSQTGCMGQLHWCGCRDIACAHKL
jgi:hypothetical protein